MRHVFQLVCLTALLGIASGCSFNRAWESAAITPTPSDDVTGRWEGTWVSEVNQHHGRLRCILARDEAGVHQARFHATFFGVLSAGYTVPLQIAREGGDFRLQGEQNLGRLAGGVFSYDGMASPTNFFCTYRSKSDHGTFQMTRPQ